VKDELGESLGVLDVYLYDIVCVEDQRSVEIHQLIAVPMIDELPTFVPPYLQFDRHIIEEHNIFAIIIHYKFSNRIFF